MACRGCPAVASVAGRINAAGGIPGIAIRVRDLAVYQKLLPHFGEAGTAVFAVEDVEYGGHDRPRRLIHRHAIISLGVQG